MSGKVILDPKGVSETLFIYFNFADELSSTELILTHEVAATVYSGEDAAPEDIIDGSATHSGSEVSQSITGGLAGVTYLLACSIGTDQGQVLTKTAYLVVEDD